MAKIVDILFRLKDDATAGLERMRASLAESNKQWTRVGQQISRTGRKIENIGSGLTKSLTLPIVGAGAMAVNKFADVDKTMSLVNATMGNSAKSAEMLNKAMSDAAANSTFGMAEAADAALNFARGGWNAEQAANALAPAMNLAAGEGGDLDTVSAGLMATMNAFKAPADQAAHYTDVFANACNKSALDVNSLAEAMGVAAPIFKTGGLGVEDAALAMGVMANNGTEANKAANALKSGMARLAAPTKDAAAWLKKLHINAFDSNGKMKDMVTIQEDLNKSFSGLSAKEKESAAAAIFGKNQMAAWLGLINTAPKDVEKLSESIGKQGTSASMASAMMEGFGGSIERLKSSFDVFMTSMGKPLGEVLSPFIGKLQSLMDKFNALDDEQKKTIIRIGLTAAAIGPATMAFGKLVQGVGGAVKTVGTFGKFAMKIPSIGAAISGAFSGVNSISGAIGALGKSIVAVIGPAGAVVAAIAGIVGVSILVWKNWDKIKKFGERAFKPLEPIINMFKETFNDMKEKVSEGFNQIKSAADKAVKPITSQIEKIKKHISELADNKAFQQFAEVVKKIAGSLIAMKLAKIRYAFEATFNAISNVVKGGIETIGKWLEGVTKAFDGLIRFVDGVFKGDWEKAWSGIKDFFSGIFKSLVSVATAPLKAVKGVVKGIADAIGNIKMPDWVPLIGGKKISEAFKPVTDTFGKVGNAFGKFKNTLLSGFGKVRSSASSMVKPIANKLGELKEVFVDIAKGIAQRIVHVKSEIGRLARTPAFQNIKKAVSGIKTHIIEFAKAAGEKIGDIINWFKKLGDNPVFQKIVHVIKDILVDTITAALEGLKAVFTSVFEAINNVVTVVIDTISNVIEGLMEVFSGLIDFLSGVFTGNWEKAWNGIKDIFKGIADSLVAIIKAPINAIIAIINGAISGINSIHVKIPKWVPGMGGSDFSPSIPTISQLYAGTDFWKGGLVQINEKGGEIIDLPRGSRVYPHDESVKKAYSDGARNSSINIAKIADTIVVREDADIDRIAAAIAHKLEITKTDMVI